MQGVIEDLIRWIGYLALRLITFGRYRGGSERDRLPEGAVGLGVLAVLVYVTYVLKTA